MEKTFEQLELGDFLIFKKEVEDDELTVEIDGFIEEKGIDYIKVSKRPEEPKWLISQKYYNKNKHYFKIMED